VKVINKYAIRTRGTGKYYVVNIRIYKLQFLWTGVIMKQYSMDE